MEHKLVFPTYEEMHEKAVKLGHLIKSKNINFDKMVVVSRGGFVPAAVVAYTLGIQDVDICLLYTSPSPRDLSTSRMPSSA